MPAQSLLTEIFVLSKHPPGDRFQTLALFSWEHGNLTAFQRVTRKAASATQALDLFDHAAVRLETSNRGQTFFLTESRILVRHAGIGRSYDSLRHASAFAAVIARNPVHEESRRGVATLLAESLGAFASGGRPDIVYLKSLYQFARNEGYPLKEHWFPGLPAQERLSLAAVLNRPLGEQVANPETVATLRRRMEEYLRGHTEIIVPDTPGR